PTGAICNLACGYCFYLEKENLYPGKSDFRMSTEVLESYIRQYIDAQPGDHVYFAWQGGEPTLLGVDFFKRAVELQQKYADGKTIENAFQTNGVLIDDKWAEFFYENKFLIGISIDGPEKFHDRYRVNRGRKGSFKQVMRGMEFLKKHRVEFNTLTVVQNHNSQYPLEIYHFLKEIGSTFIQFIPIVERISEMNTSHGLKLISPDSKSTAHVTEWSVEPEQYGIFLSEIFDEWVLSDVGKYYVQIFDVALEAWIGLNPNLCVFSETCGNAMAIEHNGDLYSCDHYVYPENKLGNILDDSLINLVNSDQQKNFGMDKKSTLPQYCINCDVRFACNGECPKHRFADTPDGESGLNYLCAGYKHFFHHIDPYMRFMAIELQHQRPPANVMEWAKDKDKGFPSFKLSPNDPCPCGSGKKLKICCGRIV
ncbi:MAG TPA: anaerobic sulfatase-maturation protein, partial [Caldithrix sp.]|nr:anaerobic sulfatase-maturation protein [Caldithrix sp.]